MFSLIAEYFQGSLQPTLTLKKQCWALQTEQAVADNPACLPSFVSSELRAECLARQRVRLAAGLGWFSILVILHYLHPPALGGSKPPAAAEAVTHGSASLQAIDVSDGQIPRSVFYTDELAAA